MTGDNPKQGIWPAAVAGRGGGSRAPYAPRDLVALALLSIGVALVGVVGYAYVSSEGYPTDPPSWPPSRCWALSSSPWWR